MINIFFTFITDFFLVEVPRLNVLSDSVNSLFTFSCFRGKLGINDTSMTAGIIRCHLIIAPFTHAPLNCTTTLKLSGHAVCEISA